jgi:hypothetical protein
LDAIVTSLALTLGAAWASGINLYAAVLVLGYLNMTDHITLPAELQFLSNEWVLLVAGIMYCVEFFADKTPGVDTGWDTLHTFIRIPAGGILAANAVGDTTLGTALIAGLGGGSLSAATHASKAGSRVLINTSPEPFTNWGASLSEDVLVVGGLWLALYYPWVFLIFLVIFLVLLIWALPKLWRAIRQVFVRINRFLGRSRLPPSPPAAS